MCEQSLLSRSKKKKCKTWWEYTVAYSFVNMRKWNGKKRMKFALPVGLRMDREDGLAEAQDVIP